MNLRDSFKEALKQAMRARQSDTSATIRLILAALKDRDIVARQKGNAEGINDSEILLMLQSMKKKCNESFKAYSVAGRQDLSDAELKEIKVIDKFLPKSMDEDEMQQALKDAINKAQATSLRDMGKVMAILRTRYAGKMDFAATAETLKQMLIN